MVGTGVLQAQDANWKLRPPHTPVLLPHPPLLLTGAPTSLLSADGITSPMAVPQEHREPWQALAPSPLLLTHLPFSQHLFDPSLSLPPSPATLVSDTFSSEADRTAHKSCGHPREVGGP